MACCSDACNCCISVSSVSISTFKLFVFSLMTSFSCDPSMDGYLPSLVKLDKESWIFTTSFSWSTWGRKLPSPNDATPRSCVSKWAVPLTSPADNFSSLDVNIWTTFSSSLMDSDGCDLSWWICSSVANLWANRSSWFSFSKTLSCYFRCSTSLRSDAELPHWFSLLLESRNWSSAAIRFWSRIESLKVVSRTFKSDGARSSNGWLVVGSRVSDSISSSFRFTSGVSSLVNAGCTWSMESSLCWNT